MIFQSFFKNGSGVVNNKSFLLIKVKDVLKGIVVWQLKLIKLNFNV